MMKVGAGLLLAVGFATATSLGGAYAQSTVPLGEAGAPDETVPASLLALPPGDRPVVVAVSFELRDITEIDDAAETFEFSGVLKLEWRNPRQAFDPRREQVDEKVYQGWFQFSEIATAWYPQVVLVNQSGHYESAGVSLRVEPDGSSTMTQTINARAEADLNLRRYPFDTHRLSATFEILGVDDDEVAFEAESSARGVDRVRIPQWTLTNVSAASGSHAGRNGTASTFVVSIDIEREPFFVVRLVVIPLVLIVMLSWSVFWMQRSSLADRISVSFIGILTAVAYQIIVSEIQPDISYLTLMHGFLNLSFMIMCATVLVNLRVGALDREGKVEQGDRLDWRCRIIFPVTYFGLSFVMLVVTFTFF